MPLSTHSLERRGYGAAVLLLTARGQGQRLPLAPSTGHVATGVRAVVGAVLHGLGRRVGGGGLLLLLLLLVGGGVLRAGPASRLWGGGGGLTV